MHCVKIPSSALSAFLWSLLNLSLSISFLTSLRTWARSLAIFRLSFRESVKCEFECHLKYVQSTHTLIFCQIAVHQVTLLLLERIKFFGPTSGCMTISRRTTEDLLLKINDASGMVFGFGRFLFMTYLSTCMQFPRGLILPLLHFLPLRRQTDFALMPRLGPKFFLPWGEAF